MCDTCISYWNYTVTKIEISQLSITIVVSTYNEFDLDTVLIDSNYLDIFITEFHNIIWRQLR